LTVWEVRDQAVQRASKAEAYWWSWGTAEKKARDEKDAFRGGLQSKAEIYEVDEKKAKLLERNI